MRRTLVLLTIAAFMPAGPSPAAGDPAARVRAQAEWILEAASGDGAIALTPERSVVAPYVGNLAAIGLARAFALTRDERFAAAAWRWLDWYQRRQDPLTGFIEDHEADGRGWRATGRVDATDSAAATFLLALGETYRSTGDAAHLRIMKTAIRRSLRAIAATTDTDGMTYALPDFEWKYTMDQAEVRAGLLAATQVAAAAGDPIAAADAARAAAALALTAERLWDERAGVYDWGLHRSGARGLTDMTRWYPGATAQPWVIAFGLAPPQRHARMLAAFDAHHPDWDDPVAMKLNDAGGGAAPAGYWPLIGLAYARTGDPARAATGAEAIRRHASGQNHIFPFTPAIAAGLILVETEPSVLALRTSA